MPATTVPVIDVAPLVKGGSAGAITSLAAELDCACRAHGFFSVVGHGVPDALGADLDACCRAFFALDDAEKANIAMARGGRAWRGWFPLGGELTSGVPDGKEGIYFGAELSADDRRVIARTALHGPNLFPDRPAELRELTLRWMAEMTTLGHTLMRGLSIALGLSPDALGELTRDPTVLFRVFRYPPGPPGHQFDWGVAEHTDYGLLTMLRQDGSGGLQVRVEGHWVEIPPEPDALVCNLGDMIELLTSGRYRSTPHRVIRPARGERISLPFFFDPAWDARPVPLTDSLGRDLDDGATRWDRTSVHEFTGTYGEYLSAKVAKVFPELFREVV